MERIAAPAENVKKGQQKQRFCVRRLHVSGLENNFIFVVDIRHGIPEDTPMKNETVNETLRAATHAYREAYVARAEELYMERLVSMRSKLAAAGMDLDIVAPYPRSDVGRRDYRTAIAIRNAYSHYFVADTKGRGYRMPKDPYIVIEKPDAEAKCRAEARQDANACFDSYLFKLAGKIAKPIKQATYRGHLWDGSELSVVCEDDETQVWKTRCIINVSVYGKLFNQWPTRRY